MSAAAVTEIPGGVVLLSIEPDGPVPIYQQIRDRIVEAIAGGRQRPAPRCRPPGSWRSTWESTSTP